MTYVSEYTDTPNKSDLAQYEKSATLSYMVAILTLKNIKLELQVKDIHGDSYAWHKKRVWNGKNLRPRRQHWIVILFYIHSSKILYKC